MHFERKMNELSIYLCLSASSAVLCRCAKLMLTRILQYLFKKGPTYLESLYCILAQDYKHEQMYT